MSFPVVPGSEKQSFEDRLAQQEMSLLTGRASLTIYLNGGSDTRRAVAEGWQDYARSRNLGFSRMGGCIVVIGGQA